jgi:hypothetical protein
MCVVDPHKWSCAHGRCNQQGNLKLQSSFVKLLLTQLVKRFPAFTKCKGSTTCWIWSSHCREYEEYLFCNVTPCIKIKTLLAFRRNILPQSSRSKSKQNTILSACFLLRFLFDLEDGGSMFLQNSVYLYQTAWCHIPEDSTLCFKTLSKTLSLLLGSSSHCRNLLRQNQF